MSRRHGYVLLASALMVATMFALQLGMQAKVEAWAKEGAALHVGQQALVAVAHTWGRWSWFLAPIVLLAPLAVVALADAARPRRPR